MASNAGKHRAPAKHRARGRGAGFTTRLTAPHPGGSRRADATPKVAQASPVAVAIRERTGPERELVDLPAAIGDREAVDVREAVVNREPEAIALPAAPPAADPEPPARRGFRISPAFAAVTAASLGVTGAVGAGVLVAGSHRTGAINNLAVSDLGGRGALTAKRAAELKPKSAKPRHTTRTVTPKPKPTVSEKPEKVVPATGEDVIDRTAVERLRAAERASRAAEREALARERAAKERARMESGSPKEIAARLVAARGWSDAQYQCLVTMWTRESSWNHHAVNASSGAYGIPQALPGSKMAAYGSDWRDNPTTQIKWGLAYIESRYGTPCGAWSWWQAHNWY
ncbi:transglycosylase SLT domain-containing protein [Actinopolymorpha sp. NPDC004070]|uniref:aggregation-promoting factor C-terminal-like domain-containing protein n=1 Tax=Actinopolymorpha sp. NPDC004070 TaxID=3154548 RepID=UPI0033A106B3